MAFSFSDLKDLTIYDFERQAVDAGLKTVPKAPPDLNRRCVIVKLSKQMLISEAITMDPDAPVLPPNLLKELGLPHGARIVKWAVDPLKEYFIILYRHESFPPIPEGCMFPVWDKDKKAGVYEIPEPKKKLGKRQPMIYTI